MEISKASIIEKIIAGGTVAFFFGVFLNWLINWRNRPQLKIIINLESSLGPDFHWISMAITNQGKSAFREREMNWHIYRPHTLEGEFIGEDRKPLDKNRYPFVKLGESIIDDIQCSHLSDWNKQPIFPGKEIQIFKFRLRRPYKAEEIRVRYEFSTKLGSRPNWVWRIWRPQRLRDRNGFPRLHLLPYARIRDIRNSKYKGELFVPPDRLSGLNY